jgi:hypothetical protein
MSKHQKAFENSQHARFMRPDIARFLKPGTDPASVYPTLDPTLGPTAMKYSPNQPRDDCGRWTDGDVFGAEANSAADDATQLANVIRVCILSGVARTTGYLGRQYTAFYDCANGLSVKQNGWGHRVPGFILDPH